MRLVKLPCIINPAEQGAHMNRYDFIRSLLTPDQLADLEKVQDALDNDPDCLEKKKEEVQNA